VKVEEGLDTFIVIDGLPVVPEDSRQKLVKFLLRKLNSVGSTSEDAVFMPVNDKKMTEGCVLAYSQRDGGNVNDL
jgi:translation initiation factor 3 subunit B